MLSPNPAVPRSYDFHVLGVRVNAVQIPDVLSQMERWIRNPERARFITLTGMHGVNEARRDPQFRGILNAADLVLPDGMPLVWLGRWDGHPLKRRVYGPELMETFCRVTADRYRHFLYGGAVGVPERLAEVLNQRFGTLVVGTYSPLFRTLTKKEKDEIAARIRGSNPDVVWVGLSTPKQEHWMYEHRDQLSVPVL